MKIQPATDYQRRAVERAIQLLRDALICAKTAKCPKLTGKIRSAIRSAGGAERHVHHRMSRSNKATPALATNITVCGDWLASA